MSSNLFNEWPLWCYFTNHKKNLPYYTEEFRSKIVPDKGIRVRDDPYFNPILEKLDMYDFMQDKIVTGSEVPDLYLVSSTSLMGGQTTVPSNTYVVVKGVKESSGPNKGRGGEIIPLVGTPSDLYNIIAAIQAYNKGKTITTLDDLRRRVNIESLLEQPGYKNPLIRIILRSYSKTSDSLLKLQEEVNNLKQQLASRPATSPIPDRVKVIQLINSSLGKPISIKAINITTGSLVTTLGNRYQIQEMMLTRRGESKPINVKIAIPNNISMDMRQEYMNMIKEEFKAQNVESTVVSEQEREQILYRPLTAISIEQARLFDESESFINFMNKNKEISLYPAIDTSQVGGEAPIQEEEEEFNELEEDELDEY